MKARKYNRLIELWKTTETVNDFGDTLVTSELLTKVWCEIKTPNSYIRSTEFGITDTSNKLVINLRKRNDITYNSNDYFFVYNNETYNIISEPINVGFENREITITVEKVPNNRGFDELNGQGNQYQHQNQNQNGQGG